MEISRISPIYFEQENMKIFNFIQNIFFEQYTIYEVLRFKFLLESEKPNMICSRDSQCPKIIENVSRSRISRHAPMGLIMYDDSQWA